MKTILTFLLLSLCLVSAAQTTYKNFKLVDGDLIYQEVVDTALTLSAAEEYYRSIPSVRNITLHEGYLVADFDQMRLSPAKDSDKSVGYPIYRGRIKCEVKEDRYRLTVFGVVSDFITGTMTEGLPFKAESLAAVFVKKGVIPPKSHKGLDVYDQQFQRYFRVRVSALNKDDF